jgi:hypothetical protein
MILMAALCRDAATAQLVPVDTTTHQTVGGVAITGDPMVVSFTKLNGDVYFLGTLASNNVASLAVMNTAWSTFLLTNQPGHVGLGVVNSNDFDPGTMWWLANCLTPDSSGKVTATSFKGGLLDNAGSGGLTTYVPTANGDGTWTWAAPTGGGSSYPDISDSGGNVTIANNLSIQNGFSSDWGQIYSDGDGDFTVGGAFSIGICNSGMINNSAQFTSDGDLFYSDGGGNVTATGFKGSLLDELGNSGMATYVPTANGDGTWTWAAGGGGGSFPDISDSGGFVLLTGNLAISGTFVSDSGDFKSDGSGNVIMNSLSSDRGQITTDGGGDLSIASNVNADKASFNQTTPGEIWDDVGNNGGAGQVITANGDGTWNWAAGSGGGGGGVMNFDSGAINSDGSGDAHFGGSVVMGTSTAPSGYPTSPFTLVDTPDDVALVINYNGNNGFGLAVADAGWTVNDTFYFTCSQFEAYSYSYPMYLGGPSFGFNNYSPAETVDINGSFGCDYELITSDGGGNLTAQSFNPVSDRNRKEQITPMAPANALAMALAMTNYTWRFKAHTNWAVVKIPTSLSTNLVAHTRTNKVGRILTVTNSVVVTNSFVLQTNMAKAFPASGKEFGPMAQDWHAATGLGSGTNISMTSEAGLLLGAVQGLAQQQGIFTNRAGARFALVVNDATNGLVFVPQ